MTRLHEEIETALPVETTFDFAADFANAQRWDPGSLDRHGSTTDRSASVHGSRWTCGWVDASRR